jgi:hypothetical protein
MNRLDMTGAWFGHFAYRDGVTPPVQFIATLSEDAGRLRGEVSEPNSIGVSAPYLNAVLEGERDGREVRLTKLYDGAADAAHSVAYQGALSACGEVCEGEWRLLGERGGFRMTRSHPDEEERAGMEDHALQGRAADG